MKWCCTKKCFLEPDGLDLDFKLQCAQQAKSTWFRMASTGIQKLLLPSRIHILTKFSGQTVMKSSLHLCTSIWKTTPWTVEPGWQKSFISLWASFSLGWKSMFVGLKWLVQGPEGSHVSCLWQSTARNMWSWKIRQMKVIRGSQRSKIRKLIFGIKRNTGKIGPHTSFWSNI